jgi:hypothetical protein
MNLYFNVSNHLGSVLICTNIIYWSISVWTKLRFLLDLLLWRNGEHLIPKYNEPKWNSIYFVLQSWQACLPRTYDLIPPINPRHSLRAFTLKRKKILATRHGSSMHVRTSILNSIFDSSIVPCHAVYNSDVFFCFVIEILLFQEKKFSR